jgi:hypothetical protein
MEDNDFNRGFKESAQDAKDGMKGMMVASFTINLVMSGAMSFMLTWINSLQMVLHLPMMLILIPPNVSSFFSLILPVVQFDLLDPEWTTELIFKFDENPEESFGDEFEMKVFDQMKDLGYETHNSVRLLGSLLIFKVLWLVRVFIYYPIVKLYVKITKKGGKYLKSLSDTLFYGEVIIISIESFIEFLIAGYLNQRYQLFTAYGETFAVFTSYYCLLLCCIVLPLVMIFILRQEPEKFSDPTFQTKYGALWDGIKMHNKPSIAFNGIFMARRIIFVVICFYSEKYPAQQF